MTLKIEDRCLAAALRAFPYEGRITGLKSFGSGHINDTYAVYVADEAEDSIGYILQKLNTHVFRRPQEVMENIMNVTSFLREKCGDDDTGCGTLHFLKTKTGEVAFADEEGMPWRSYRFIKNSFCYEQSPTPEIFYESAKAFGDFLYRLQDYPADSLHETIPDFHDTRRRLAALRQAVEQDKMHRAKSCRQEVDFVFERAEDCALLMDMLEAGDLPLRVTHNDTKLNNVLFDSQTGRAICVIDLDTIMPGLSLNDFGDSIRFGATTAAEDEPDLAKVHLSLPLFEAYAKGYLETAGTALTETEIELLPQGARIITLECGIRFLTDYLEGDTYFKIDRPGHNLDRCRTQFKLVQEMEQYFDEMKALVQKYARAARRA